MHRYRVGDATIASASTIRGLAEVAQSPDEWRFRISRIDPPPLRRPYHRAVWPGTGQPWRTIGRLPSGHIVHFHRAATFVLDVHSLEIIAFPRRDQARATLHQLLLSQVLPLVLGFGGRVVLHASAAASAGSAIGFVGAPRHGKSSIALALAVRGYSLAADDCLVVDPSRGCRVVPVDIGVRLWPDAAARHRATAAGRRAGFAGHAYGKRRATLGELGVHRVGRPPTLRRIYLLRPDALRVSSSRVAPRDAVIRLLEASFQLGHDSRAAMVDSFRQLTQLAASVDVRQLAYPRSAHCLPEIVSAIAADG